MASSKQLFFGYEALERVQEGLAFLACHLASSEPESSSSSLPVGAALAKETLRRACHNPHLPIDEPLVLLRCLFDEALATLSTSNTSRVNLINGLLQGAQLFDQELKQLTLPFDPNQDILSPITQYLALSSQEQEQVNDILRHNYPLAPAWIDRSIPSDTDTNKPIPEQLSGLSLPYGPTNHQDPISTSYTSPMLLCTSASPCPLALLLPILKQLKQRQKNMIVLAPSFGPDSLATFAINRLFQLVSVIPIAIPHQTCLHEAAAFAHTQLLAPASLTSPKLHQLGSVYKAHVTSSSTTLCQPLSTAEPAKEQWLYLPSDREQPLATTLKLLHAWQEGDAVLGNGIALTQAHRTTHRHLQEAPLPPSEEQVGVDTFLRACSRYIEIGDRGSPVALSHDQPVIDSYPDLHNRFAAAIGAAHELLSVEVIAVSSPSSWDEGH